MLARIDFLLCRPLDKGLETFSPTDVGGFPDAASGGCRAILSFGDESACSNVELHPIAWVVTIRSCCRLIPSSSNNRGFFLPALSICSTVPVCLLY